MPNDFSSFYQSTRRTSPPPGLYDVRPKYPFFKDESYSIAIDIPTNINILLLNQIYNINL